MCDVILIGGTIVVLMTVLFCVFLSFLAGCDLRSFTLGVKSSQSEVLVAGRQGILHAMRTASDANPCSFSVTSKPSQSTAARNRIVGIVLYHW